MKTRDLISFLWGFLLGFLPTALFDVSFTDWQWWVMVMPIIILVRAEHYFSQKGD